jgi:protein-tyrosine phosphatase
VIDLHHHCLPGVDEGPASLADAVAQCRQALDDGIETIVATPHVLCDPWINDRPAELDRRLLELNAALEGRPRVLPGCEYWFGADAVELAARGAAGPLIALNRRNHLLVEFPSLDAPAEARDVLYEWTLLGFTPVIAHPERNSVFRRQPERLEELVALGCVTQVTAMSVTGNFGTAAQEACSDFFRRGLVHLVATDAHSRDRRPPLLSRARAWVRNNWGADAEEGFFEGNPAAVIEGAPLPFTPERTPERRSFLSRGRATR